MTSKSYTEQFRNSILGLTTDLEVHPKKMYIAFRKGKRNYVYMSIGTKQIRIWLNMPFNQLDDPKQLAKMLPILDIGAMAIVR